MKIKTLEIKLFFITLLFLSFVNFFFKTYHEISTGSDINSYLYNLDIYAVQQKTDNIISAKGYFYELISFFNLFLKLDAKNLFILIFNIISFLLTLILFRDALRSKNILVSFLIVSMVLLTPSVLEFLISNVRSSLAFVLFLIGLNYQSKLFKFIFFSISLSIHLLILPLLIIYIMFVMLNRVPLLNKFDLYLNYIIIFTLNALIFYYTINFVFLKPYNKGFLYIIFTLSFFAIFVYLKKSIKFVEGYLAINSILIVCIASILNLDFTRYFPISLIFFSIFLLKHNNKNYLKIYSIYYFFMFTVEWVNFYRSVIFLS